MSMLGTEERKFLVVLLCIMFVLAAAPSASIADQQGMSKQAASSDSDIMSHALMTGHIGEAWHAAHDNKDLKGAATHTQMAIKAGESVQAAFGRANVDPEKQRELNEGIQSLKEALKLAESGDSEGFEKAAAAATDKVIQKCHGPGCATLGCGCAPTQMGLCDPLRPAKKCTKVGCNCFCL